MEPLESGQIQPLGLSHAIGPPGWRPKFQGGIPSILKRLKHPKPISFGTPLAQGPIEGRFQGPRHLQGGSRGQRAQFLCSQIFFLASWPPLAPPAPPFSTQRKRGSRVLAACLFLPPAPLARLAPWPPRPPPPLPPSLAPPAPGFSSGPGRPLRSLPFSAEKCLPVLAAKAEVGIEGASPKP